MKEITCKDCVHFQIEKNNNWCFVGGNKNKKDHICKHFTSKDGKRPRFCRLASSVDEMAKEMVFERRFQGEPPEWFFVKDENFNIGGSKHEAIASAKAWLMEVEE